MWQHFPEILQGGVNYVDVGCSGSLGQRWTPLEKVINFVGFEPNREEVARLEQLPTPYRQARYLPFAVSGQTGEATLYETQSPYCYSLRRPRHSWLRRFAFHSLFEETGQSSVSTVTLDQMAATEDLHADVLKLDTQGLELPILQTSDSILAEVFCVETETGFVENYVHETVTSQVDQFMRERGFMMFDINIHRVERDNPLGKASNKQPLWCEIVWLRDWLSEQSWGIPVSMPSRVSALKALTICWALGVSDYGLELATFFARQGILDHTDVEPLWSPAAWSGQKTNDQRGKLATLLRVLPRRWRRKLAMAAAA